MVIQKEKLNLRKKLKTQCERNINGETCQIKWHSNRNLLFFMQNTVAHCKTSICDISLKFFSIA